MNRPSFRRHNRVFKSGILSGALPWIIAGTLILLILGTLRMVAPQALMSLATPLWGVGQRAATLVTGSASFADAVAREAEQAALIAQNAQLQARVADLTTLLGTRVEPEKGIVAGVMVRPPVAPYDVLIVDQGTVSGVQVGALAYGVGGTPIGEVTEVSAQTARVTLYSTRGSVQQAWAGASRAPIELSGMGSGAFEATSPRDASVVVGDTVYLAGGGALPIGTVVAIDDNSSSPNITLYVRPYTNPFSLPWVTIARDAQ